MKRFVIEREMPSVGTLEREQMRAAAEKSNSVLRQLGRDIQWIESHVTQDKIYCVYLAKDAALIRKHADTGTEMYKKPLRHLEFMIENRRRYYRAVGEGPA